MKRKAGRPPRGAKPASPVTVRFTARELAAIAREVKRQGAPATVSSWIRERSLFGLAVEVAQEGGGGFDDGRGVRPTRIVELAADGPEQLGGRDQRLIERLE
jgi:hypothetical protein